MADREILIRSGRLRRALDAALLGGVSLLALMLGSNPGAARGLTPGGSVGSTVAAQQAVAAAAQQASAAATQAQAALARAAAALAAARKFQADAAAAARASSSSVANGLATGGLMPFGGTAADPSAGIRAGTTAWTLSGDLPVQTSNGSQVTVDINQTQAKAIFYWDTFNVGAKTTVNFNQRASDWIALNRVLDPSGAPSKILGQINALGAVYLINRNGIVFGAGAQVNVHTLVASSLDIGKLGTDLTARDQYFFNTGIGNLNSFSVLDPDASVGAATKFLPGDVTVERGASITANIRTDIAALGSPGSIYLFGKNVSNSGLLTVPTGEVGMVAARIIDLIPNGYSALPTAVLGTDADGNALTFRGTEFMLSQFGSAYDSSGYPTVQGGFNYLAGTGAVTHDGLIEASRGIVIMNGDKIAINNPGGGSLRDASGTLIQGVISVDTSIDRNSMVLLRAATSVTLNGVISSLPFDDGADPLPSGSSSGSTVQSFTPAYIELSAKGEMTLGSSGLVSAPSAQVAVKTLGSGIGSLFAQGGTQGNIASNGSNAGVSILLNPGATIDVAGLQNVELPASYNFISFQPRAEFADMPLQRDGVLYGKTLWIDIRASGTRADGTSWVGTPLADASGYVNAVGRSIYQLMTVGGQVSLSTGASAGTVQTTGAVINVAGGSVTFLPGVVPVTRLLGIDGRIYNMTNADPNMTYVGFAGQFTVDHARWGVTETWSVGTQTYVSGYTEGRNAGGVAVTTLTPTLGAMYFGSVAGERQIAAGSLPLQGSLTLTTTSDVQIGTAPSDNFTANPLYSVTLSADTLSSYGLSTLAITAYDLVVSSGSTLSLAAGGSFSVKAAGIVDIAGTVSAAGGAISLETDYYGLHNVSGLFQSSPINNSKVAANIFVEGTLDVSGRFVNDTGRFGTDASGPAFINGGTISISTNLNSSAIDSKQVDTTGSILLAKTSVLDVSSGGYISAQGKPKTVAGGGMAGKAGSVSLAIVQSNSWRPRESGSPVPEFPESGTIAVLQLDGSLRGYGFESNGGLRLVAFDTIRIGGTLQPGETSSIRVNGVATTLPVALLTGGGFGDYTIESLADGWTGATANIIVSAGVSLALQQQNLSSVADYSDTATGTKLGQQAQLATLPDDQRKPVNLTLRADNILLDTGSKIVTDPKSAIAFGGIDGLLKVTDPLRNAAAKSVQFLGSIVDPSGAVLVNALKTYLGPQAVVDLSGIFVANSRFGEPKGPSTGGSYLSGGSFTVEAAGLRTINVLIDTSDVTKHYLYYTYGLPGTGYLVADRGAIVDVSGAAGLVEVAGGHGTSTSVWSWSDAGTISADVTGFAWGGSFVATGGRYLGADGIVHADLRANNGTFILGGGSILLRQDMTDVNAHLSAPQSLYVSADQLAPFDNIYLYSGAAVGGAARLFDELPAYNRLAGRNVVAGTYEVAGSTYNIPWTFTGRPNMVFNPLTISGSLDWHVQTGLRIAAGTIASSTTTDNSTVTLDAPYLLLTGGNGTAASGRNTLTISGQAIDIFGAVSLSGFAQANFVSSGDIRLGTRKVSNTIATGTGASTAASSFTGSLDSKGDVLLKAQRIYPVSAVDFTITTPGKVKFLAPAGSDAAIPLAAGGGMTVIASAIEQAGNLFAPLGKITLGNTDSTVSSIITQSVTLEPGSLTSVTLADTVVPYGATLDGTNWYYNANLDPMSQPPTKGLVLDGANVVRADGSTIDLRGGGDLQAIEWIQGNGGSRDTLNKTTLGQTVYALVPSQSTAVAAFDIHFTTLRTLTLDTGKTIMVGDADPLVGTQITIAGGNGIAAGTYTLYPAHYATLPGAMRVVYYGSNIGRNVASGTTLPDGTVLVTGYTTQSTASATQSSGQSLFAVQTSAVWRKYSEYNLSSANSYYRALATKNGSLVPRLPMDAGRLAVLAQQSILLAGVALTQPGQDSLGTTGRGGELDISAPQLAVIGHAQYVNNDIAAGYVGLDLTQVEGFESVLIGGLRSDTTTGTLITARATNVLVDTQGETFTAPEILLVAKTAGEWQRLRQSVQVGSDPANTVLIELPVYVPIAGTGVVTVKAGSVIETTGAVHNGYGRRFYFPSNSGTTPAQQIATALGGTVASSGTAITGVDLAKLQAALAAQTSTGFNSLAYYAYGGGAMDPLGALFAASNDPDLVLSGPAGASVSALTLQFADVTKGKVTGLPAAVEGAVTGTVTLQGGDSGRVSIENGTRIATDTLTLQATAATNAINLETNDLHADQVNLTAHSIAIGSNPPAASGKSLILAANSGRFGDVHGLTLRALTGGISVYGNFDAGAVMERLTLDAAVVARGDSSGAAKVSAKRGTITLANSGADASTGSASTAGDLGLTLEAADIVLGGGGKQAILGYARLNWLASDRVLVAGSGALTLGTATDKVDFTVTTPTILVASATVSGTKSFGITTLGNVILADTTPRSGAVDRPTDSAETNGVFAITAASISVGNTIQAQAGTITLDATAGDVTLQTGAYLAAGGYKKTLIDVDTYVAGGKVVLKADAGNVVTASGSVIDVAQPQDGLGYAGEIDVTALNGGATLHGTLRGSGGPGLGGRFYLDIKGAADLTRLADTLLDGGITGVIEIQTRTGNLELQAGHTLQANAVSLTADDPTWDNTDTSKQLGQLTIAGTINADGYSGYTADGLWQAGGQVGLFGHNRVTLKSTARISATTSHADERGGDVMIGTAWAAGGNADPSQNSTAGYIDLQAGSVIDVSGGTKGGLSGGTVTLRAPLDGANDVKIAGLDSTIRGARAVYIQGFITINTEATPNNVSGIDGSKLTTKDGTAVTWDGYIDPAGAVTSSGAAIDFGVWTGVSGVKLTYSGGSGYTSVPNISIGTLNGSLVGNYYQVIDPVTGAIYRSSLRIASVQVTNGGSYTTAPTVVVAAPNEGSSATFNLQMRYTNNTLTLSTSSAVPYTNVAFYSSAGVMMARGKIAPDATTPGRYTVTITTYPSNVAITNLNPSSIKLCSSLACLTGTFVDITNTSSVVSGSLYVYAIVPVDGGSGYVSSSQASLTLQGGVGTSLATASVSMGAAVTILGVSKGYTAAAIAPKIVADATSCPTATCTATTVALATTTTTGLTGATKPQGTSNVFVPGSNYLPLATSKVFAGTADSAVLTISPYADHQLLYTDVLANFVEGNGIQGVGLTGSYGFSNLFARLQNGLVGQLGASIVHVQPGIELVNTSTSKNSGDITVASNWNLAAVSAVGNLKTVTTPGSVTYNYFDPATGYVNFIYRLATPWGGLDAGALTLRAVRNVNVNASISDGFFQAGNYSDADYVNWLYTYVQSTRMINAISSLQHGSLNYYYLNKYSSGAVPIAPYKDAANSVSPTAQDLAGADLFPNSLNVCTVDCSAANIKQVTDPSSWSYSLTAGADVASANPTAMISLANAGGKGDVIIDNHTNYSQTEFYTPAGNNYTSKNVDVSLATMVRTGTGNIAITAAQDVILRDKVAPGVIYAAGVNSAKLADANYSGTSSVVAGNAEGFYEPKVLAYGYSEGLLYYGPPTAAAFPEQGGDVTVEAQRDIIGYSGSGNKTLQYYQPWLLSDAGVSPATTQASGLSISLVGQGVFAPLGSQIASQTAWWIQYGSFQQGILSAGGNVTVTAGRDLIDVSVSLPTTGRVSGGLSATSTPVTHLYGSGNMLVRAGRDILGGAFYEGSGHASIIAGGAVGQNGTMTSKLKLADVPLLAVDTGQIAMTAGGALTIAGVINPAELHLQTPSWANPLEVSWQLSGYLHIDSYGPDSKVRLVAATGDLTIDYSTQNLYPASFEALALKGSLITSGKTGFGIVLSPSEHGSFLLLAQGDVDLTFGSSGGIPISAGAALLETAFDPFQPNNGYDGAFSKGTLAQQDYSSAQIARIYAVTGDITATGGYVEANPNAGIRISSYKRIEINRPTKIYAGGDIVDLNLVVQNIYQTDVSTIEAGGSIYYTGTNNGGGLQVAGPGFFVVQAGGDIGPFLPAAYDLASTARVQEGITSVGNATMTAVGNSGFVGIYNASLLGPYENPRRNALLTEAAGTAQGADIVVLFGAKYGADYQAVVDTYINPANAAKVAYNYLGELRDFLARVGIATTSTQDAWNKFTNADKLAVPPVSQDLRQIFVDKVFFAELKAVGISEQAGVTQHQRGYEVINTLFPASLGYTANALGDGISGTSERVWTGDLNLLHSTIQTKLGGDISIFGPGGNVIVGSLAAESNKNLKLRDLGILTLGGGAINIFTDQSALVNSSRVLTTQGGDVLMWSSNGDLDAGRGSKTTLSAPALQVEFDQDDYQTIDLGGFVTGAGIGTLKASRVAKKSSVYLMAPRGKIDFGTAGARSSDNLVVIAPVVANASNVSVAGATTGIPMISVPNVGALTAGSNAAGAAAKSAETPSASGNRDRASIFIVEVVGYGGGDGQSRSAPSGADSESEPQARGTDQQPDRKDRRQQ
ncbi:filamentous haemagglutinin family protein [Rhodopseudomonas palustris]|uniref:Filamentous haemagglutinin-like n=1 Tax=Rhodopseudomonas palustris (strain BisB18) TaxID=316056 RepID=Q212Z4_RHOPB